MFSINEGEYMLSFDDGWCEDSGRSKVLMLSRGEGVEVLLHFDENAIVEITWFQMIISSCHMAAPAWSMLSIRVNICLIWDRIISRVELCAIDNEGGYGFGREGDSVVLAATAQESFVGLAAFVRTRVFLALSLYRKLPNHTGNTCK